VPDQVPGTSRVPVESSLPTAILWVHRAGLLWYASPVNAPSSPSVDAATAQTTDSRSVPPAAGGDRQGTTDGRYTLRRELARGGMGQIWVADDEKLSRRVAVKELLEASGTRSLRFARELSLTSRLEHPSIVSIHDGGTWPDGKPFYVMKLVSGTSLQHHRAGLQQVEQLLRSDATNVRLRGMEAFLQRLIASVLHRQGKLDDAIAAFERSRVTTEKLAADEPANERWQTDLGYLYADLAEARGDHGDLPIALDLKRKSLAVAERIAAANPSNISAQSDVADGHVGLAIALGKTGDLDGAAASLRKALEISEAVAAKTPSAGFTERVEMLRKQLATCCTKPAKR
jgi:tetratricopeptide (TPR) repeat protein